MLQKINESVLTCYVIFYLFYNVKSNKDSHEKSFPTIFVYHRNILLFEKINCMKIKNGTFFWIYSLPVGLEDVSKYPDLFAKLREGGWSTNDLKKLAGENFIRVFKDVEKVTIINHNKLLLTVKGNVFMMSRMLSCCSIWTRNRKVKVIYLFGLRVQVYI